MTLLATPEQLPLSLPLPCLPPSLTLNTNAMKTFNHVTTQLPGMRKPAQFTAFPHTNGGEYLIQSDRRIARFNLATGAGIMSTRGSRSFHLDADKGAVPFTASRELLEEVNRLEAVRLERQRERRGVKPTATATAPTTSPADELDAHAESDAALFAKYSR